MSESQFRGLRIRNDSDGYAAQLEPMCLDDLSPGEVDIRVAYSSVNYKDALAGTGKGRICRSFPMNGGIDVAGHVVASRDPRFREGDPVLVTGSGLSETRDGGYSEYARIQAEWAVPLPEGLTLSEAMGIGTAGFTAALCLWRLLANGQQPDAGPIVVTGATGGVGMLALDILSGFGFEMHAITGKPQHFDFLKSIGARQCVSREGLYWGQRPLESTSWAGAIDNVGGEMLSGLTRVIKPWGSIASCGLAGGTELHTTVMPFIIRGVSLLGINSSATPYPIRNELWQHLATDWKPKHLSSIVTAEVEFEELPAVFDRILAGDSFGRTLVRIGGE